jgi:hypothetical protein
VQYCSLPWRPQFPVGTELSDVWELPTRPTPIPRLAMFPWSSATDKSARAAEKLFDAIESDDAAKVRALLRKGRVDANAPSDKVSRRD